MSVSSFARRLNASCESGSGIEFIGPSKNAASQQNLILDVLI